MKWWQLEFIHMILVSRSVFWYQAFLCSSLLSSVSTSWFCRHLIFTIRCLIFISLLGLPCPVSQSVVDWVELPFIFGKGGTYPYGPPLQWTALRWWWWGLRDWCFVWSKNVLLFKSVNFNVFICKDNEWTSFQFKNSCQRGSAGEMTKIKFSSWVNLPRKQQTLRLRSYLLPINCE